MIRSVFKNQNRMPAYPPLSKTNLSIKYWIGFSVVGLLLMSFGLSILISESNVANSQSALLGLFDGLSTVLLLALGLLTTLGCFWRINRLFFEVTSQNIRLSEAQQELQQELTRLAQENNSVAQQELETQISEPSSSRTLDTNGSSPNNNPLLLPLPRQDRQGPKIVALGGGTGMPQLLRGLRAYTDNITAIVTVADDGGSSGRLRRQMGMLPPGDFRNNIAALSEAEELVTRLLQYRFPKRQIVGSDGTESSELAGHSFGNLFIATMAAVTGSFESGLSESSRVLAVRGRVLPSTLEQVNLCAEVRRLRVHNTVEPDSIDSDPAEEHYTEIEEWSVIQGESNIPEAGGQIIRVFLEPENVRAYPEAIRAILQAELIVAGPGSFFTSVIPNLLVPSVRDAICASTAPRIYLCNVATQQGETDNYSVSDHMRQLRLHTGQAFTTVLANDNYNIAIPPSSSAQWVPLPTPDEPINYQLFTGDLIDDRRPWRHDPAKLSARVMELYAELTTGNIIS